VLRALFREEMSSSEIDDVMGELWLRIVDDDLRKLVAEVHGNRTRRAARERRPTGFEDQAPHQPGTHFRRSF
jgi:hypothetical protein